MSMYQTLEKLYHLDQQIITKISKAVFVKAIILNDDEKIDGDFINALNSQIPIEYKEIINLIEEYTKTQYKFFHEILIKTRINNFLTLGNSLNTTDTLTNIKEEIYKFMLFENIDYRQKLVTAMKYASTKAQSKIHLSDMYAGNIYTHIIYIDPLNIEEKIKALTEEIEILHIVQQLVNPVDSQKLLLDIIDNTKERSNMC